VGESKAFGEASMTLLSEDFREKLQTKLSKEAFIRRPQTITDY